MEESGTGDKDKDVAGGGTSLAIVAYKPRTEIRLIATICVNIYRRGLSFSATAVPFELSIFCPRVGSFSARRRSKKVLQLLEKLPVVRWPSVRKSALNPPEESPNTDLVPRNRSLTLSKSVLHQLVFTASVHKRKSFTSKIGRKYHQLMKRASVRHKKFKTSYRKVYDQKLKNKDVIWGKWTSFKRATSMRGHRKTCLLISASPWNDEDFGAFGECSVKRAGQRCWRRLSKKFKSRRSRPSLRVKISEWLQNTHSGANHCREFKVPGFYSHTQNDNHNASSESIQESSPEIEIISLDPADLLFNHRTTAGCAERTTKDVRDEKTDILESSPRSPVSDRPFLRLDKEAGRDSVEIEVTDISETSILSYAGYYFGDPNSGVISITSALEHAVSEEETNRPQNLNLYYASSNDDNSFNEWRKAPGHKSFFRPLSLIKSSSHFGWLFDWEGNCEDLEAGSPQFCIAVTNASPSAVSANDFGKGFRKFLERVGKALKKVEISSILRRIPKKDAFSSLECFPEEATDSLNGGANSSGIIDMISAPFKQDAILTETTETTRAWTSSFLETDDIHDSNSVLENAEAGVNLSTFIHRTQLEDSFNFSKILKGSWIEDIIHGDTLWHALCLDKISSCQKFRREFSRGSEFSLFREAKKHFKEPFVFTDLTSEVANYAEGKAENVIGEASRVSFNDDISVIDSSKKGQPNADGNKLETNALTKGIIKCQRVDNSLVTDPPRAFKQDVSENTKKALDRVLWANVMKCQERLVELKLEAIGTTHQQMLDAFRECFRFSRVHYACVAKNQILEYVSVLSQLRKHSLYLLEFLVGVAYEYAALLEYLSTSDESEKSLEEAERSLSSLQNSLSSSCILLEGVQKAISQMGDSFPEDVVITISMAQNAVISRNECSDTYEKFRQLQTHISEETELQQLDPEFEALIKESDFLVDRMGLFQLSNFKSELDHLSRSHKLTRDIQQNLDLHVNNILRGINTFQCEAGESTEIFSGAVTGKALNSAD